MNRQAPEVVKETQVEVRQPLFRVEVLEERNTQWLGPIRLAQPISSWILVSAAVVITAAVVALVIFGTYAKRVRVPGILVASGGSLTLTTPSDGVLLGVNIKEGQRVVAGMPLFEISSQRQARSGEVYLLIAAQITLRESTIRAEKNARQRDALERSKMLDSRVHNLKKEEEQLAEEIVLARRRLHMATMSLNKYERLERDGFMAPVLTQQKLEDVIDVQGRISALSRGLIENKAKIMSVESDRQTENRDYHLVMAQLDRAQATIAQEKVENDSRRSVTVVAPRNGVITTITYQSGQSVVAGQPLATLVATDIGGNDEAALEAHLYAPSRLIGFVIPGHEVLLRHHAFPYQKFGTQKGVVSDVSKTPFAPTELPGNLAATIMENLAQATGRSNEGLYRIKVRVDQNARNSYKKNDSLRPGMTLDADLLQDERRLWEWLADPLFAFVH